ncbi:2029_t:CDS:1 [Acaulospora morrowiae]|uniref:2029_t:CDS:1 n=1 Tax=Acaulospora morrowiae TaxID=94023 RepID=A0A9N9AMG7_9GLOM|nr:2029_t:CDS:1 [Acaulospora morrowiae]
MPETRNKLSRVPSKPPVLPPLLIHSSPYHAIDFQDFQEDNNDITWSLNDDASGKNGKLKAVQEPKFPPQKAVRFDLRPHPKTTRQPLNSILMAFSSSSGAVAPEQSSSQDAKIPFTLLSNDGDKVYEAYDGEEYEEIIHTRNGPKRFNDNLWDLPWRKHGKLTRKFWFVFLISISVLIFIILTTGVVCLLVFWHDN